MHTTQAVPPAQPAPKPVITNEAGSNTYTLTAPLTARDVAAIKARREELSEQLNSASSRRSRLVSQLNATDNETARRGLEERITILDKRMVQLESDIAATGQQLTSAPAGLVATTASAGGIAGLGSGQITALSIVFTVIVLGPLAIAAAIIMLRRSSKPPLPPAAFTQTAERLERLEQSVDTIAIEIERISEGQRFVTKLLSEGSAQTALSGSRQGQHARIGAPAEPE